jgi:hypothetical protein
MDDGSTPGSGTPDHEAAFSRLQSVTASWASSTVMQAQDSVACKHTSADAEASTTSKADHRLLDISGDAAADPQGFVPDLSKCLRGCLNPAGGVHHAKCPNYKRAAAKVEVASKALLVPSEHDHADGLCPLHSKEPAAMVHVRQHVAAHAASLDPTSLEADAKISNVQSLESVESSARKEGSMASTPVTGIQSHDVPNGQKSVKASSPCSPVPLTQDSVACECTSVDADAVAGEADGMRFAQPDDAALEHEFGATADVVPRGLVSERIQQHLKFIRSQC